MTKYINFNSIFDSQHFVAFAQIVKEVCTGRILARWKAKVSFLHDHVLVR